MVWVEAVATATYKWYIAASGDAGQTWGAPSPIDSGLVANNTGGDRSAAYPINNPNPSFTIGKNNHCIVAYPKQDASGSHSQKIYVRESADGVIWNLTYTSPASPYAGPHDAFNQALVRNTWSTSDSHVILMWYDTRLDSNNPGRLWGVYAVSSPTDAVTGSWDTTPISARDTALLFTAAVGAGGGYGDYIQGAPWSANGGGAPNYLFAWVDSRTAGTRKLYGTFVTPTP